MNFIMEKEGLSYQEALMQLARKYGIEIEERELTEEERRERSEREAMLVANEWAMQQMEHDMLHTDEGRDVGLQYFSQRGVTDEAIHAFRLGYAIDKGNYLRDKALKAGFDLEVLKTLGLIGTSQQGHDYDRFRGRVIFPILSAAGKAIAFGGRDLKGGLAKYINSPESALYKKSNELYGIFQAKGAIVKQDKCFLVEGYMDVIGMWQAGMKNVVASSGTALTDGQIAMIHRFTNNITLIYDGDAAGIKASLRGIDMLLSHRLNVKVLLLPDGDDPDSFARKHSPDEFKEYVETHETDVIRYKAEVLLGNIPDDPRRRIEAVKSVVQSIAHIPDQVARDVYVQECASILKMDEATIAKAVGNAYLALVEQRKRERNNKSIASGDNYEAESMSKPVAPTFNTNNPPIAKNNSESTTPGNKNKHSAFSTLEESVLKYCIRYAYVPFCSYENENGEEVQMDVLDFVMEELRESQMDFSSSTHKNIIFILQSLRNDFTTHYASKASAIEIECAKIREKGVNEIAAADMSVAEIKKAEKKIESEIEEHRKRELSDFVKDFPGRMLASHEDDKVRELALRLMFEKHQLSNIYRKEATHDSEEDKLQILVVRALDEWKNEIINQRMAQLFSEFSDISGTGDLKKERELQAKLAALMRIRAEMAKAIGERIIFNGRKLH